MGPPLARASVFRFIAWPYAARIGAVSATERGVTKRHSQPPSLSRTLLAYSARVFGVSYSGSKLMLTSRKFFARTGSPRLARCKRLRTLVAYGHARPSPQRV